MVDGVGESARYGDGDLEGSMKSPPMLSESADWAFKDSVGEPEYGMGDAAGAGRKEK